MTHLHIFALNEPVAISHTNLTRQNGEAPDLPPLAEWLGLDDLDSEQIELFPLSDLGGMPLSDYIQLAFTPEASIPSDTRQRIDALGGAVLLVPEAAMTGTPAPGPKATEVARIALAVADHTADLPKAEVTRSEAAAPRSTPDREASPPIALFMLLGIAAFAALILLFGWG